MKQALRAFFIMLFAYLPFSQLQASRQDPDAAAKERADFVTSGEDGAGVEELTEKLLSNDLADVTPRPKSPQTFSVK
jgi:hypothetical protein